MMSYEIIWFASRLQNWIKSTGSDENCGSTLSVSTSKVMQCLWKYHTHYVIFNSITQGSLLVEVGQKHTGVQVLHVASDWTKTTTNCEYVIILSHREQKA